MIESHQFISIYMWCNGQAMILVSLIITFMDMLSALAFCFLYITETYEEDYISIFGEDCMDSGYSLAEI